MTVPLELRPFQNRMIGEARALLARGRKRICMQAPTGAGKTILASAMVRGAVANGRRVWFLCHRDFLMDQTSQTFERYGIDHGFIAANRPFNPHGLVSIGSIATVANRIDIIPDALKPDLIIPDETHHAVTGSWRKVLDWASSAAFVGLTATPIRLDGTGLDEIYTDLVLGPPVAELIRDGFLSRYRAYAPSTPDTSGLKTRAGDFARDQVNDLMDRNAVIGDMVRHYKALAAGQRAVYFCASIAHSQHVAETFTANGVRFVHMDGNTPSMERRAVCRQLARGEIQGITNVDLFGEGFDLAAQAQMDVTIDCVGLARPTQSLTLALQQFGRGLRPRKGKECATILDHAGNVFRHGLPDEDREWSLQGAREEGGGKGSALGTKNCKQCFTILPQSASRCQWCGYVYEAESREVEHVDGELHEVDAEAVARQRVKSEAECRTIEEFMRLAEHLGKKDPERWAERRYLRREQWAMFRAQSQFEAYGR